MIPRIGALVAAVAMVTSTTATGQLRLRLDGGSMNPDDPFAVTLAYGAQVGWRLSERDAWFFRVTWQQLSADLAGFPRDDLRRYLSLGYERYLGWEESHQRQFALRFGAGVAIRSPLKTAPFVSGGVSLRYPISTRFAFLATFEDALAALPTDTIADCRYNPCLVWRSGGKAQHNFGMFISVELRP
jgi:hypothetical protein